MKNLNEDLLCAWNDFLASPSNFDDEKKNLIDSIEPNNTSK